MEYILIEEEKERTAIASNTVRSIRKADFADSGTCRIFVERDTGDFNRFLPDDFCIAEMSALELTKWLKGEQEESKDDEEEENNITYGDPKEAKKALDKAFSQARDNLAELINNFAKHLRESNKQLFTKDGLLKIQWRKDE